MGLNIDKYKHAPLKMALALEIISTVLVLWISR